MPYTLAKSSKQIPEAETSSTARCHGSAEIVEMRSPSALLSLTKHPGLPLDPSEKRKTSSRKNLDHKITFHDGNSGSADPDCKTFRYHFPRSRAK